MRMQPPTPDPVPAGSRLCFPVNGYRPCFPGLCTENIQTSHVLFFYRHINSGLDWNYHILDNQTWLLWPLQSLC